MEVKKLKTRDDLDIPRKIAGDEDKWKNLLRQFAALHMSVYA